MKQDEEIHFDIFEGLQVVVTCRPVLVQLVLSFLT